MQRLSPWFVAAACVLSSGLPCIGDAGASALALAAGSTRDVLADTLSKADLEEMLAPIALYPDTLLANTLAACVYEDDFKAAAAYVAGGGKVDESTTNDWDPSVKAIAQFPEVIKMMGENPDWAAALGQAYLAQGADVMAAVQALRAKAWNNGALRSTPQQTVVTEGTTIIIEPAQPQIIYVPTYNPSVVYVNTYNPNNTAAAGLIGFGLGVTAGLIIANNMDCHWHGGYIGWGYHNNYYRGGNNYYGNRNDVDININGDVNIGRGGNTINRGDNTINRGGNTINNRPGQDGSAWKPNQSKVKPSTTSGANLGNYKGVGSGGASGAKVPGRASGSQPISKGNASTMPAARPSTPTARPSAPTARPSTPTSRPSTPAAKPASKPSTPAARPASKPSSPSAQPAQRSSGFNPSGGGGSRSGSGGGASRSGGGGSRGGGGGRGR